MKLYLSFAAASLVGLGAMTAPQTASAMPHTTHLAQGLGASSAIVHKTSGFDGYGFGLWGHGCGFGQGGGTGYTGCFIYEKGYRGYYGYNPYRYNKRYYNGRDSYRYGKSYRGKGRKAYR